MNALFDSARDITAAVTREAAIQAGDLLSAEQVAAYHMLQAQQASYRGDLDAEVMHSLCAKVAMYEIDMSKYATVILQTNMRKRQHDK